MVPELTDRQGRSRGLLVALVLIAVVSASPQARADAPPWGAAHAGSLAAEQDGRFAEAAELLAPFAATFEQDYGFVMRIAWLWYRAGRFERALPLYEQGVRLSGGAALATLGEGWTLLQLGRRSPAKERFEAVLAVDPTNASAREGLELSSPAAVVLVPHGSVAIHTYTNNPSKKWGIGAGAGLDAWLYERGHLALAYRFTHVATSSGRFSTTDPFDQHEVWVGAGIGWPIAGLTLRYGLIDDGSGTLGQGHVLGGAVRVSPYGDIIADTTYTLWDDLSVLRVGLSYRIPIVSGLSLRPFGALQLVDGELLFMGGGAAEWATDRFGLVAHGRGGTEERPALADPGAVYDFYERIDLGLGGGAWVNVSERVCLAASYEYLHLSFDDRVFGYDSSAHLITIGVEGRVGGR